LLGACPRDTFLHMFSGLSTTINSTGAPPAPFHSPHRAATSILWISAKVPATQARAAGGGSERAAVEEGGEGPLARGAAPQPGHSGPVPSPGAPSAATNTHKP